MTTQQLHPSGSSHPDEKIAKKHFTVFPSHFARFRSTLPRAPLHRLSAPPPVAGDECALRDRTCVDVCAGLPGRE